MGEYSMAEAMRQFLKTKQAEGKCTGIADYGGMGRDHGENDCPVYR